jgi:hypothetical protein
MTIDTVCANSGKAIQIQLNSDLDPLYVDPGADPMICLPRVDLLNTEEPSIVDIF